MNPFCIFCDIKLYKVCKDGSKCLQMSLINFKYTKELIGVAV